MHLDACLPCLQAIHEAVASRVEELRSLYRGAHSVVRERDGELEAARARLVEQLGMLGTAFKRRDVEIERTRDAEEVLVSVGVECRGSDVQVGVFAEGFGGRGR